MVNVDRHAVNVHVLALMRHGELITLDHVIGDVALVEQVTEQWGQIVVDIDDFDQWLLLDYAQQRVFVTAPIPGSWATVRIDLQTGDQSLLYGGEPIDRVPIQCLDDVAYDSLLDRVLYHTRSGGQNCMDAFYAVDVQSQIAERSFAP